MTRGATPKLARFVGLAGLALLGGLLLGRVELLAVAAPLAIALAVGSRSSSETGLDVAVTVDPDRCLVGDEILVTVELTTQRPLRDVEVVLVVSPEFEVAEGSGRRAVTLPLEGRSLQLKLRARRWGAYPLGVVAVRVRDAAGFAVQEGLFDRRRVVRVYPALEPILRGIRPTRTQVYSGNYVARVAGEGIEFADVRPYQSGDALQHINWRVTTRARRLHVNVYHPERNADVVLFVDTFSDPGPAGGSSLDLAVRGAASLARYYLTRKDRVGLIAFGGVLSWLTPAAGEAQALRIIDYLLDVQAKPSFAWKDIDVIPRRLLPTLAVVLAFSPLTDLRTLRLLGDLQARRYSPIVIDTLQEDLIAASEDPEGRLAWRAWRLQRNALRFELGEAGIPVVSWRDPLGLEGALLGLARSRVARVAR